MPEHSPLGTATRCRGSTARRTAAHPVRSHRRRRPSRGAEESHPSRRPRPSFSSMVLLMQAASNTVSFLSGANVTLRNVLASTQTHSIKTLRSASYVIARWSSTVVSVAAMVDKLRHMSDCVRMARGQQSTASNNKGCDLYVVANLVRHSNL